MKPINFLSFRKHQLTISYLALLVIFACGKKKETEKKETPKIVLEKLTNSPLYSDASLVLREFQNDTHENHDTIHFKFEVGDYVLGAQTDSKNNSELANSKKGQHIHFILNNQPYSAYYTPNFKKNIPHGVHHLVAFLSRSYHESVKNENSVVVTKLIAGENTKDTIGLDMEAPTLIYSRPKGKYVGNDTKGVLLDFFVINTELSEKGNKVKATINNQEFTITEWVPYVIKGLPTGITNINLELIDAKGNPIPGPFNKVTRSITIEK
ncbi:MAG: hypothetical protein ACPHXR_08170 [Flavicella sp.]